MKPAIALCALSLALALPTAAQAQVVLGPTGATTNMGSQSGFELSHLYDKSGLSSSYTNLVTDFATYTTGAKHNSSDASMVWFSTTKTGNVDFSLGGTYSVSQFALWNSGSSQNWRLTGFTLLASTDAAFSSTTNLGNFTASSSGALNAVNAQVYSFAATQASYIRMQITANAGNASTTGFGEVAFGVAAIPEPSPLALGAVVALCGAGLRWRRTRRRPAA